MPLPHNRPRGLHGQTVDTLARRVLSGEYPPGTVLDLPTLRTELDVSLTVLREALKVLSAKGMIGARQKRGTFVRPRESWNMLDADVMRWHIQATTDAGDDLEAIVAADLTFHRRLLAATHNDFLGQVAQVIAIGLAERDKFVHHANPTDDPVPSHRAVLDAVAAGDPDGAERAMRALVDKSVADLRSAKRT